MQDVTSLEVHPESIQMCNKTLEDVVTCPEMQDATSLEGHPESIQMCDKTLEDIVTYPEMQDVTSQGCTCIEV
jgi:hypothetical protein